MNTRPSRRQTSSTAHSSHKSKHEVGQRSHQPTRVSQGSSLSSGLHMSGRTEKRHDKRHTTYRGEEGKHLRIGKVPRNDLSSFQWGPSSARQSSVRDDTLKYDSGGVTKESHSDCSISSSRAKTRPRKVQYSGRDLPVGGENDDRKQSETSKTGPYSLAAQIHKVKESIISSSAEGVNSVRRKRLSARKSTSGRSYNPAAAMSSSSNTGGSHIEKQVVAVDEEVSFKLPIRDPNPQAERQPSPHKPNQRPKEDKGNNYRSKMGSSSGRGQHHKIEASTVNERSITGRNEDKRHTSSQSITYGKYKNLAKYMKTDSRNKNHENLTETSTSMGSKHKFHFVTLSQPGVSAKFSVRSPRSKYGRSRFTTQSDHPEVTKHSNHRPGNHTKDRVGGSSYATYTSKPWKGQNIKEGWKMLSLDDACRKHIIKRTKSRHGRTSSQERPQGTGQSENKVNENTKASLILLANARKEDTVKLKKHSSERNIFDMFKIPSVGASSSDQSDKNNELLELSSENSEPAPSSARCFDRLSSTIQCGDSNLGDSNVTDTSIGVTSKVVDIVSNDSSDGDNIFDKIASVESWTSNLSAPEICNVEVNKESAPSKKSSLPLKENAPPSPSHSEVKDSVSETCGDKNEKGLNPDFDEQMLPRQQTVTAGSFSGPKVSGLSENSKTVSEDSHGERVTTTDKQLDGLELCKHFNTFQKSKEQKLDKDVCLKEEASRMEQAGSTMIYTSLRRVTRSVKNEFSSGTDEGRPDEAESFPGTVSDNSNVSVTLENQSRSSNRVKNATTEGETASEVVEKASKEDNEVIDEEASFHDVTVVVDKTQFSDELSSNAGVCIENTGNIESVIDIENVSDEGDKLTETPSKTSQAVGEDTQREAEDMVSDTETMQNISTELKPVNIETVVGVNRTTDDSQDQNDGDVANGGDDVKERNNESNKGKLNDSETKDYSSSLEEEEDDGRNIFAIFENHQHREISSVSTRDSTCKKEGTSAVHSVNLVNDQEKAGPSPTLSNDSGKVKEIGNIFQILENNADSRKNCTVVSSQDEEKEQQTIEKEAAKCNLSIQVKKLEIQAKKVTDEEECQTSKDETLNVENGSSTTVRKTQLEGIKAIKSSAELSEPLQVSSRVVDSLESESVDQKFAQEPEGAPALIGEVLTKDIQHSDMNNLPDLNLDTEESGNDRKDDIEEAIDSTVSISESGNDESHGGDKQRNKRSLNNDECDKISCIFQEETSSSISDSGIMDIQPPVLEVIDTVSPPLNQGKPNSDESECMPIIVSVASVESDVDSFKTPDHRSNNHSNAMPGKEESGRHDSTETTETPHIVQDEICDVAYNDSNFGQLPSEITGTATSIEPFGSQSLVADERDVDIIDGISFMSFASKEDLLAFTSNNRKGRNKKKSSSVLGISWAMSKRKRKPLKKAAPKLPKLSIFPSNLKEQSQKQIESYQTNFLQDLRNQKRQEVLHPALLKRGVSIKKSLDCGLPLVVDLELLGVKLDGENDSSIKKKKKKKKRKRSRRSSFHDEYEILSSSLKPIPKIPEASTLPSGARTEHMSYFDDTDDFDADVLDTFTTKNLEDETWKESHDQGHTTLEPSKLDTIVEKGRISEVTSQGQSSSAISSDTPKDDNIATKILNKENEIFKPFEKPVISQTSAFFSSELDLYLHKEENKKGTSGTKEKEKAKKPSSSRHMERLNSAIQDISFSSLFKAKSKVNLPSKKAANISKKGASSKNRSEEDKELGAIEISSKQPPFLSAAGTRIGNTVLRKSTAGATRFQNDAKRTNASKREALSQTRSSTLPHVADVVAETANRGGKHAFLDRLVKNVKRATGAEGKAISKVDVAKPATSKPDPPAVKKPPVAEKGEDDLSEYTTLKIIENRIIHVSEEENIRVSSPGFLPVRDPTSPSMKKQLTKVSDSQSISKTGTSKSRRKQSYQADLACEEEHAMPREYAALPGSPANCGNDFCRLGCVCDSLTWKAEESMQHCRKLECMFECTCERFPSLRILRARKRPAIFHEDGMVFYDETGLLSDREDKKKRRLDPTLPAVKTEPSKDKSSSKAAVKPASSSIAQKVTECKKEIPPKDTSSKVLFKQLKKDPGFSRGRVYVAKHIKYAAKMEEQKQEGLKKQQKDKAESSGSNNSGTSGSVPPLKVIKTADGFLVKTSCDEELEDSFKLLRRVDRMLLLSQQYRKRKAEESGKQLVHGEKEVNPTRTRRMKDAETVEIPAKVDVCNEVVAKNARNQQDKQNTLEVKGKQRDEKSEKEILPSDHKSRQVELGEGAIQHTAKPSKDDMTDQKSQNKLKTSQNIVKVSTGTKHPSTKHSGQEAVWIATRPVNEGVPQSSGALAKPLGEQVVYSQINNSGLQSIRITRRPLNEVSSQTSVSLTKPVVQQVVHSQGNVVVSSVPVRPALIPITNPVPHAFIPLSQVPVRSGLPSQTVLQPKLMQVQPKLKPAQVKTVSSMLVQKRQLHNQGVVTQSPVQPTTIISAQPPTAVKGQPVILVPSASQTPGAKVKNIQAFLVHNPDGKTVLLVPAQKQGKPPLAAPARIPGAASVAKQKKPTPVKLPTESTLHPYHNPRVVPRLCDIAGHTTSLAHMSRKELVHVAKKKRSIFLPNTHQSNPNRAFHLLIDVFSNCSWEQNDSILNQPIFNLAATVGNVPNLKISKYTIQRLDFKKHSQVAKCINVSSSVAGNCRKKIRIIGLFESKFYITDGNDPLLRATGNGSYIFDYCQQAVITPNNQTRAIAGYKSNYIPRGVVNKSRGKYPAVQTLSGDDVMGETSVQNDVAASHLSVCDGSGLEKKNHMEQTAVESTLPVRADGGCSINQEPCGSQSLQSDAPKNESRADCVQDEALQREATLSLSCEEILEDDEMQDLSGTEKGQSCKSGKGGGCLTNQEPVRLQSLHSDAAKNESRADCVQDEALQREATLSLSCEEIPEDDEMQDLSDTEKGQSCKGGEDGSGLTNQEPFRMQSLHSDSAKNESRADCVQDEALPREETLSLSCEEIPYDDEMQVVSDTEKGQSCKGGEDGTECKDSENKCSLAEEDCSNEFVEEVQPQRVSIKPTDDRKGSGEGGATSYTSSDCYVTSNQSSGESSTFEKMTPDQIQSESSEAASSQRDHHWDEDKRDTPVQKGKEGTNLKKDETSSDEKPTKIIIDITETSPDDKLPPRNILEISEECCEKGIKNKDGVEEYKDTGSKEKGGNLGDLAGDEDNVAPLQGASDEPITESHSLANTTVAGHKLVTIKEGNENLQTKPVSLPKDDENRKLTDTQTGEKSSGDGDISQKETAPGHVSIPKGNKKAEKEEENEDDSGTPRKEGDKQFAIVNDVSKKHTNMGGDNSEGNCESTILLNQFEKQESLHLSDQDVSRSLHSLVENLSNRVTDVLTPEDVVVPEDKKEQQDTEEDDASDESSSSDEDEDNSSSESENESEDVEVMPARSQWFLGATSCTLRLAALVEKAFQGENLFTACWPEGYLEVSEPAQPGKTGFKSSFLTGDLSGIGMDWPLKPRKKEVKFMPPHSLTDLLQKRQAQREAERERAKKLAREQKKNSFKDLPPSKRLPIRDKVKSLEYCVAEKTIVLSDDDIDILAVEEDDDLSSDEESIYTTSSYEDEQRSKNEALFRLAELLPAEEDDVKCNVEDDLGAETSSGQNKKRESSQLEDKGVKDCGNDQILPQDTYSGSSDSDSDNSDDLGKLSDRGGITPKVEVSNDGSGASTPSAEQKMRLSETDQRVADLEKELYRSLHGKGALDSEDQQASSDDPKDSDSRRGNLHILKERRRRAQQRYQFERLSQLVFTTVRLDQKPKIAILTKAVKVIKKLREQAKSLDERLSAEKYYHYCLRNKLKDLLKKNPHLSHLLCDPVDGQLEEHTEGKDHHSKSKPDKSNMQDIEEQIGSGIRNLIPDHDQQPIIDVAKTAQKILSAMEIYMKRARTTDNSICHWTIESMLDGGNEQLPSYLRTKDILQKPPMEFDWEDVNFFQQARMEKAERWRKKKQEAMQNQEEFPLNTMLNHTSSTMAAMEPVDSDEEDEPHSPQSSKSSQLSSPVASPQRGEENENNLSEEEDGNFPDDISGFAFSAKDLKNTKVKKVKRKRKSKKSKKSKRKRRKYNSSSEEEINTLENLRVESDIEEEDGGWIDDEDHNDDGWEEEEDAAASESDEEASIFRTSADSKPGTVAGNGQIAEQYQSKSKEDNTPEEETETGIGSAKGAQNSLQPKLDDADINVDVKKIIPCLQVEEKEDGTLDVVLQGEFSDERLGELFARPGVMDYLKKAAALKKKAKSQSTSSSQ